MTGSDRSFYHGTRPDAAAAIARHGFRVWADDPDGGRYPRGGNLGNGIYITCDWRTALWFGPVLLAVSIRPGTRLLDGSIAPDGRRIDSLVREFGREILDKPPWKVLPRNKRLTRAELIELFRYHYQRAWERGPARHPARGEPHRALLADFRNLLVRYGYHGFGNPRDDNGMVVFADDRLCLERVAVEIPEAVYPALAQDDFRRFVSLQDLIRSFSG